MSKTESEEGKTSNGFAIRITILLLLLIAGGLGVFYDRFVLPQRHKQKQDEIWALMTSEEHKKSARGLRKDIVHRTVGFEPSNILNDEENNYVVETYKFKRLLPFVEGDEMKIIYRDDALIKIIQNGEYDPSTISPVGEVYQPPKSERKPVFVNPGLGSKKNTTSERPSENEK